jgi:glycosyltransferase involved in cell wall biosynthesis
LYRVALSRSYKIFFQNENDHIQFIEEKIINNQLTDQLPGSGIDLEYFSYVPKIIGGNNRLKFLLIARMLWDKGIAEYVMAARILRIDYPNISFILLGPLDDKNPYAVACSQMDKWVKEGIIEYHGVSDDVKFHIDKADCVVLPSYYREGVPHALLESAAIGRPIITTDSVGCRETVDDKISGYLCRPQDAVDLAEKMKLMLFLDNKQRVRMGRYGREKMKSKFDEKIVIQKYLEVVQECS